MALKLKNFFLPVLLLTLAADAIPPVYAGNGARHPMEGAAFAKYLAPAEAGGGGYVASRSEPVSRKGIAFARYQDSSFGLHYGAGVRIPIKQGRSIVINQCYHDNTFNKAINGVHSYSGWTGGLTLERNY
ncbi:MAG TPA: hypothetical protein PK843_17560 [bacterium]|nr:hypothetical protein [bacterium]HPN36316.1 hypothetical protein [bacterium]